MNYFSYFPNPKLLGDWGASWVLYQSADFHLLDPAEEQATLVLRPSAFVRGIGRNGTPSL